MKLTILSALIVLGIASFTGTAQAAPEIGQAAPDFTAKDTNGVEHNLHDFKGKNVVLEWSNDQCPFVRKHYDSGNMQKTQKEATDSGTIWLTIVSSAKGKQGNMTAKEANDLMVKEGTHSTARIMDESGAIGKSYDAKTTPHMFVIDKEGILAYAGAIDSDESFSPDSIPAATNYVSAALSNLNAGEPIKVSTSKPYGCGVKY